MDCQTGARRGPTPFPHVSGIRERSLIRGAIIKKADMMEMQAVFADPAHGRAANTRAGRQVRDEPPGYQGKDLRMPDTTPEQFTRVLLRDGAHPRTETKETQGD